MPRDERTYITVEDGMPDHPKIDALSDAAFRLLVETWCWCSRKHTDGKVRATSWSKRGSARTRAELIREGLAEPVEDGVQMHDYLEHQRSGAEIDALRQKRREAGSKGGRAKANGLALATANGKHPDSKTVPDTDTEQKTTSSVTRKRGTRLNPEWRPTAEDITWQRSEGIDDNLARRELPKFVDYWTAKAGNATKLDWSATWRNWLRTATERGPQAAPSRSGGLSSAQMQARMDDPTWPARQ